MIPLLALAALAMADLSGEWHGAITAGRQSVECEIVLAQEGDSLSGSIRSAGKEMILERGAVRGDGTVVFSAAVAAGGRLQRVSVTGTVNGDELRLDMGGVAIVVRRMAATHPDPAAGRLAGLLRLWGAIKFFHPYLAYRPIDWDAALVAAIPRVEAAATASDYASAVGAMLAALGDPETRVVSGAPPSATSGAARQRRLVRSGYPPQIGTTSGDYYVDWEETAPTAPFVIDMPDRVRVAMRTAEPGEASGPIAMADQPYGGELPSRERRLLALARLWNAVRHFYGFPDDIPGWDDTLEEFIPRFAGANTWHDYVFAVTALGARMHDSHTWIPEFWRELGALPRVDIWPIEGESVVRDASRDLAGVERGDVVVSVDGVPAARRVAELLEIYPHSTPQAGQLMANQFLLAGPEPEARVRLRKADGREVDIKLPRTTPLVARRTGPVYQVLPSGFGYIDLERLPQADVDTAFDAIMRTPGLILDLRGIPETFTEQVAARLAAKPAPATRIRQRVWHGPDPARVTYVEQTQYVRPASKARYPGPVAVLIDARAISRAEHLCLYLEAAARVTFVGSPTKGAEGAVTNVVLPGGVQVNFSGQEIRHADGRPVQGAGILPDVPAAPTIAGLRAGRDEVLERAVAFLRAGAP